MCFSPEASFSASAVLGVIGVATLRKVKDKRFYFLALIPLFFAIQQFSEGLVWLNFKNAQYVFLFFAYLVWPVWVPLSMYWVEKERVRKNILLFLLGLGALLAGADLSALVHHIPYSQVVNCSIQYDVVKLGPKLLYGLIIWASLFVSSVRWMWVFGLATLITFGVAEYFYQATFTSVWCFFAALTSAMIYAIVTSSER